jgi:hypothetical protein
MDIFEFFAELVKAVAWPITTIVLAVLLRKPIVELIPLLRKLKYKEFEVEFAREVSQLKAETATVAKEAGPSTSLDAHSSNLLNLAVFSPRAAIMEAWLEVETVSSAVASSFWGQSTPTAIRNYHKLGEYLEQCKVINQDQLHLFNRLRELRNKAAHAEDFGLNEHDARNYVQLALDLAKHIRKS